MSVVPDSDHGYCRRESSIRWTLAALLLLLAMARIWTALAYFVGEEWNDVRLRPAWLIHDGRSLYPGMEDGPATTWIYGPVLPLLMLPATLATEIKPALLTAGLLNTALLVTALAFACFGWPEPSGQRWPRSSRGLALGVSLLLVPHAFLRILQADNAVVALGLSALTCLARAGPSSPRLWVAAGLAAGALFAKWHGIAVLAGSLLWLMVSDSWTAAFRHFGRLAIACLLFTAITLLVSATPEAAWDNLVVATSRLPFLQTARWGERLKWLAPELGVLLFLPLVIVLRVFTQAGWKQSGLGLPGFVWLASLPLGLAGALTHGGHYNSLHAALFLLPVAAVAMFASLGRLPGAGRTLGWIAVGVAVSLRLSSLVPWQHGLHSRMPMEAYALARSHSTGVWLPWRPLATRLATGRHDHDEDGLLIRRLIGHSPDTTRLRAHLPPAWDATFLQADGMSWNLAVSYSPPDWVISQIGRWLIIGSRTADSDVGKGPVAPHRPH